MSIRKTAFIQEEYYHIYNRGSNKIPIFLENKDYDRFAKLLYTCNDKKKVKFSDIETRPGLAWTYKKEEELVNIHAYCLMPNHFHLLISENSINGITEFMQRLTTAYSMYFNKKYDRTGSLFQGKFKAEHINEDRYLKYLFSYIHLNPVKLIEPKWKDGISFDINKTLEYLKNYKYSSYLDYLSIDRLENKILNNKLFLEYFPDKDSIDKEIFDWLSYNDQLVQALPGH